MPLSYQRKIHRGEIHPVTLHPCKRQEKLYLTEQRPDIPWIHLRSSGLVRIWSLGRRQHLFFCVFSHFWHGHEQPNNRVILVQACSWPVRRPSFFSSHRLSWQDRRGTGWCTSQSSRWWPCSWPSAPPTSQWSHLHGKCHVLQKCAMVKFVYETDQSVELREKC